MIKLLWTCLQQTRRFARQAVSQIRQERGGKQQQRNRASYKHMRRRIWVATYRLELQQRLRQARTLEQLARPGSLNNSKWPQNWIILDRYALDRPRDWKLLPAEAWHVIQQDYPELLRHRPRQHRQQEPGRRPGEQAQTWFHMGRVRLSWCVWPFPKNGDPASSSTHDHVYYVATNYIVQCQAGSSANAPAITTLRAELADPEAIGDFS